MITVTYKHHSDKSPLADDQFRNHLDMVLRRYDSTQNNYFVVTHRQAKFRAGSAYPRNPLSG